MTSAGERIDAEFWAATQNFASVVLAVCDWFASGWMKHRIETMLKHGCFRGIDQHPFNLTPAQAAAWQQQQEAE